MSGFTSSTSNLNVLKQILEQLVVNETADHDVLERIQEQAAMMSDAGNLRLGERHYDSD